MISEDKFFEKSDKFALYPTTDGTYFLWNELEEKIKLNQPTKTELSDSLRYEVQMNSTLIFSLQKIKDMKLSS